MTATDDLAELKRKLDGMEPELVGEEEITEIEMALRRLPTQALRMADDGFEEEIAAALERGQRLENRTDERNRIAELVRVGYRDCLELAEEAGIGGGHLEQAFDEIVIGGLLEQRVKYQYPNGLNSGYRERDAEKWRQEVISESLRDKLNGLHPIYLVPAAVIGVLGATVGAAAGLIGASGVVLATVGIHLGRAAFEKHKAKKNSERYEFEQSLRPILQALERKWMVRQDQSDYYNQTYCRPYREVKVDMDAVVDAFAEYGLEIDYESVLERAAELHVEEVRAENNARVNDAYIEDEVSERLRLDGESRWALQSAYRDEYKASLEHSEVDPGEFHERVEHCFGLMEERKAADERYSIKVEVAHELAQLNGRTVDQGDGTPTYRIANLAMLADKGND